MLEGGEGRRERKERAERRTWVTGEAEGMHGTTSSKHSKRERGTTAPMTTAGFGADTRLLGCVSCSRL